MQHETVVSSSKVTLPLCALRAGILLAENTENPSSIPQLQWLIHSHAFSNSNHVANIVQREGDMTPALNQAEPKH
jgi:hypothetical protein